MMKEMEKGKNIMEQIIYYLKGFIIMDNYIKVKNIIIIEI